MSVLCREGGGAEGGDGTEERRGWGKRLKKIKIRKKYIIIISKK